MKFIFSLQIFVFVALQSQIGFSQEVICQNGEIEYEIIIDSLTCNNQDGKISINITNGDIESFFWIGPATFFSVSQNIEVELPGSYRLMLTGTDGCIVQDTINIEFNSEAFNQTVSTPKITCFDTEVNISIDPAPSNYSYKWEKKADYSFSAPDTSSIDVSEGGIYFVSITRPTDNCRVKEWTYVSTDTIVPDLSLDFQDLTCDVDQVILQSDIFNWPIDTVTWSGPGINASNENDFLPIVSEPGEYIIMGSAVNGCQFSNTGFVDDQIINITSYEDADGDGFGNPFVFVESCEIPNGFTEMQGDCDDQDSMINPNADDLDSNGIDENCDGVDGLSDINEIILFEFSIFPNPTFDELKIKSNFPEVLNYSINSMDGRAILNGKVNGSLDVSILENGVYYLKISNNEKGLLFAQKLVKI